MRFMKLNQLTSPFGHINYWMLLLFLSVALVMNACKVKDYATEAQAIDHIQWDSLLKAHVNNEGWVSYEGFVKDSVRLNAYLELLSNHHPNPSTWTREERMAYWINAYNAFTVKLIVDNYPVEGIKEIKNGIPFVNTVWDIKFIQIQGQKYDLNNIEHGILRPKFKDPRIHFAVNCASISCPKLLNEAFTAEKLDEQLNQAATAFINDPSRNVIEPNQLKLSKIFKWYGGDFTGGKKEYIQQFTNVEIAENAKVEYLEYDWGLNKVLNE